MTTSLARPRYVHPSSHHPQEVLLAQFSLYVHKGGLKPDSFHFLCSSMNDENGTLTNVILHTVFICRD